LEDSKENEESEMNFFIKYWEYIMIM